MIKETKPMKGIIYVHGQGGNAEEAQHYRSLFPGFDVIGMEYHAQKPWEAINEFSSYFDSFSIQYEEVYLIANSLGAYFSLLSLSQKPIKKAILISPIVDMERLILDMMTWASVTEEQLKEKQIIEVSFGEPLSWQYLTWVRQHPIQWSLPTTILYGDKDHLQSLSTIQAFTDKVGATLNVVGGGEHWFHTEEQLRFVDACTKAFINEGCDHEVVS